MAERPTYSLKILFGTIAAFAIAAGAFAAPPSVMSGLLVLMLATCSPGLLVIVWRSGAGYRRSFVIGAAAPSVVCAYRLLKMIEGTNFTGVPTVKQIVEYAGLWPRAVALTFITLALGGGLAGIAVHWLVAAPGPHAPTRPDDDAT